MQPCCELGIAANPGNGFGEPDEDSLGRFLREGDAGEPPFRDGIHQIGVNPNEFGESTLRPCLSELSQIVSSVHLLLESSLQVKR